MAVEGRKGNRIGGWDEKECKVSAGVKESEKERIEDEKNEQRWVGTGCGGGGGG